MNLRCLTRDYPKTWMDWLSWAESCYNTSFHSALRTTPFEVVYGRSPPILRTYYPGLTRLAYVDIELKQRDLVLSNLRDRLLQAQATMKHSYDASHHDVQFWIGDMVLLKLQPYRLLSLTARRNKKLSPRWSV